MSSADLHDRLRSRVSELDAISEKRIVGGTGFLWHGNLLCGVVSGDLVLRLGRDGVAAVRSLPGVSPMSMGARTSSTWVLVGAADVADDTALDMWLARAVTYVATLPTR